MRILLLGATGRTGKLVLKKALNDGYQVNCLARSSHRIEKQTGLTIIEGNPTHKTDLEKAIKNCDYVISVLNISRKSDFPWASLKTPKTYLSDVMSLLVPIAEKQSLRRIVACSAWGVSDTENDMPKWFKWFVDNSNIGIAYKDHGRQEKIIPRSKLNWTIVRPVGLTNSNREQIIIETFNNIPNPNLVISRKSVAKYLVDSLKNDQLIRKKIVISKR